MAKELPKAFLERLKAVKGKRSRTVVDHILKHGHITTEDLKDTYRYDHPPRGPGCARTGNPTRDVQGIRAAWQADRRLPVCGSGGNSWRSACRAARFFKETQR